MIDQYPPANGVLTSLIWRKTAAGGETSLSGYDNASQALSYTPGQEQVYLNGILLVRGSDYTATNGTSITSLSALAADDFVQINCYNNFSVASVPAASITGTVTNDQLAGSIANNKLANSSITINGSATSLGGSYTNASASTSTAGIVQLTDSTSSTSTTTAATPNSVKSAYDLANGAIPKTLTTTTGDIIYASGANTPARLGIGSSGQVLGISAGIPAWTTPASGGGMTLISTTALTSSSVTLSSIPTTYKNLQLIVRNYKPSLDGYGFQVRVNADSGANRHYSAYTFQAINQSFNNTLWIIGGPDNVEDNGLMVLNFWDYTNTTTWKIASSFSIRNHETSGTNLTMEPSHHAYNQTTAITSLVLSVSGGTFTGTALLYGVS